MGNELIIFAAFLGLQTAFHSSHKLMEHPLVYKISHKPWLVWIFHPTVLHGVQDYGIHFVVYRGKIIAGH